MEQLLLKLIELMKELSPQLWAILMKQTYANAFTETAVGLFVLAMAVFSIVMLVRAYRDGSLEEYVNIVFWIVAPMTLIIGLIFLCSGLQRYYNPEYYAIDSILEMIRGAQ